MQKYVADPDAPHVVLQEDGRPAIKFAHMRDAITCARDCNADCILSGFLIHHAELVA